MRCIINSFVSYVLGSSRVSERGRERYFSVFFLKRLPFLSFCKVSEVSAVVHFFEAYIAPMSEGSKATGVASARDVCDEMRAVLYCILY